MSAFFAPNIAKSQSYTTRQTVWSGVGGSVFDDVFTWHRNPQAPAPTNSRLCARINSIGSSRLENQSTSPVSVPLSVGAGIQVWVGFSFLSVGTGTIPLNPVHISGWNPTSSPFWYPTVTSTVTIATSSLCGSASLVGSGQYLLRVIAGPVWQPPPNVISLSGWYRYSEARLIYEQTFVSNWFLTTNVVSYGAPLASANNSGVYLDVVSAPTFNSQAIELFLSGGDPGAPFTIDAGDWLNPTPLPGGATNWVDGAVRQIYQGTLDAAGELLLSIPTSAPPLTGPLAVLPGATLVFQLTHVSEPSLPSAPQATVVSSATQSVYGGIPFVSRNNAPSQDVGAPISPPPLPPPPASVLATSNALEIRF